MTRSQPALFVPTTATVRITEDWRIVKDGDHAARRLFQRHYSYKPYKDGRSPALFVGPGEKLVLLNEEATALFVWRRFLDDWLGRHAVWCAVFRNEGPRLSSDLILQAERVAQCRWPREPMFTHVRPSAVKSANPGYCFNVAGWKKVGQSRSGTHVLSKSP